MSSPTSSPAGFRFLCPGCGTSFGWKPQYAGRKIRCRCGKVFVPPEPPAAATEPLEPQEYDVDDGPGPVPQPASAAARPAPVGGPSSVAAPSFAAAAALYPGRRARPAAQEAGRAREESAFRELYLPIAMLALGLGLRAAMLLVANERRGNKWGGHVQTPDDAKKAVLLAAFELIIAGGVMIAGATLAATVLNLNFGTLGRAALKLCAIAVFATGVASWVALFDQGRFSVAGLMIALHVQVLIYWAGFAYLFALELQETLLAVAIISLLQAAAMCALWKA